MFVIKILNVPDCAQTLSCQRGINVYQFSVSTLKGAMYKKQCFLYYIMKLFWSNLVNILK